MERIQVSNDEMVAGHGVEPQNPLPKAGLVWHRDVWYGVHTGIITVGGV